MATKGERASALEVVPYPSIPLEEIYRSPRVWRGLTSRHTGDLRLIAVLILVTSYFVARAIWGRTDLFWNSQVIAAMFTAFLATFAAAYQVGKLRFSTVDIFSSEILARLRMLSSEDAVGRIIRAVETSHPRRDQEERGHEGHIHHSYLEPSSESHFENYFRRSSDLGTLAPPIVDHATDFYSFHMALRENLRELAWAIENFPDEKDEIKARTLDALFMFDLMAYSGSRALNELIESKAHRLHSIQIALSICTQANRHLHEHMPRSDRRHEEVARRNSKYVKLVSGLKRDIKSYFGLRRLFPKGTGFF